jgi:Phosphotransferase enzyme family
MDRVNEPSVHATATSPSPIPTLISLSGRAPVLPYTAQLRTSPGDKSGQMVAKDDGNCTVQTAWSTEPIRDGARSINDSWFNRFLVLIAVKVLRRFRPRRGSVLFLTDKLCVKYGPLRHLPEASTIEFVAQNTSIPVPKIYCAFKHKRCTYILMERVKGESLGCGWVLRSPESKAKILKQLTGMVESMRRLRPLSPAVANIDGGRLWDCRLPGKSLDFGPFENVDAFHSYLRGGIREKSDNLPPDVNELMELHDREGSSPVLTHGDLNSFNIMAEGDRITAIVDWETAGWYPYYWEYTTACYINFLNPFWREEVDKFLVPWPEELRMEELRRIHLGDV